MKTVFWFIIGVFVGGAVGVAAVAILVGREVADDVRTEALRDHKAALKAVREVEA